MTRFIRLSITLTLLMAPLTAAALMLATVCIGAAQDTGSGALTNPAALQDTAPETYRVTFDTSAGTFVIQVHRAWAPHGADRFYKSFQNPP